MIESKSFPIGGTKIEYLAPYLIWCLSISKKEREINATEWEDTVKLSNFNQPYF